MDLSTAEVCDQTGLERQTVLRWADEAGIERRGSGYRRLWTEDEVRVLKVAVALHDPGPNFTPGTRSRWRSWREALPARRLPGGVLLVYANGSSRAFRSDVEALDWVEDEGVTRFVRIPA